MWSNVESIVTKSISDGESSHFVNFPLHQFPLCQFTLCQHLPNDKMGIDKMGIDKVGIDKVGTDKGGINHCENAMLLFCSVCSHIFAMILPLFSTECQGPSVITK